MDEKTQHAMDTVLQDEVLQNERVVTHPNPKYGRIRFRRPNPAQERKIAEIRGREYHRLLQDETILSRAQLEAISVRRGMWSTEKQEKTRELSRRSGEIMILLESLGFKDAEDLERRHMALLEKAHALFEEGTDGFEAVDRYFDLENPPRLLDRRTISEEATTTEVDDILNEADSLRTQIDLLQEFHDARAELNELQAHQTRLFMDSLEAQVDRAEEIAQIYFCVTAEDTDKPLWPSYAEAWEADKEDIAFLQLELFYYLNGILPETKGMWEKYGFMPRVPGTNVSSEDSPEHPSASSDGAPAEETPSTSSESEASGSSTASS